MSKKELSSEEGVEPRWMGWSCWEKAERGGEMLGGGGKKSTPAGGWTERQPEGTKGWEMFLFPDMEPEIFGQA